ncbi:hypothetical protein O1B53_003550 [Vibrio cholerae]|nr:hypothetical protein [Vibrio cholerae]
MWIAMKAAFALTTLGFLLLALVNGYFYLDRYLSRPKEGEKGKLRAKKAAANKRRIRF